MSDEFETGVVRGIRDEIAEVELHSNEACDHCGAKHICRPGANGKRILRLPNTLGAKVGDTVNIEQQGANQLRLTTIQYGLPLLSFLIGVFIGSLVLPDSMLFLPRDLSSFLMGIALLLLSGLFIRHWTTHKSRQNFHVFRMDSILHS